MIADKRTKCYRQLTQIVIGVTCLLLGALLNKWQMTPTWESKQLKLGTSLLSPVPQNDLVFAREKPQDTPKPSPTPIDPIEYRKQIVRDVFGKDADDAIKVFMCEGLRSNKCNDGLNKNGSFDCGVAQINSVHGIARKWLLNPEINIRVAYQIFQAQGWNPWTCKYVLN